MISKNEIILTPEQRDVLENTPTEVICEKLRHYLQNHQTIDIEKIECKVAKSIDHNHE